MTDHSVVASLPGAAPLKQQIAEWRESARAVREQAVSAEEQHYFGAGNALASKAAQLEACADDLEAMVGAALEAGPSPTPEEIDKQLVEVRKEIAPLVEPLRKLWSPDPLRDVPIGEAGPVDKMSPIDNDNDCDP